MFAITINPIVFQYRYAEFDPQIVWIFDLTTNKVEIINRIESEYPYILASGEYDIKNDNDTITISTLAYNYYIKDNKLIVSNKPHLDGPVMTFISR